MTVHHHYISLLTKSVKLNWSQNSFRAQVWVSTRRKASGGTGMQSWMKLSPWNLEQHSLTKAQLPAQVPPHTPDTLTLTYSALVCFTHVKNWDLERPPSFLVGHSQGRDGFSALPPREVFEFHTSEKHRGWHCCSEGLPRAPPAHPSVPAVKSPSSNDCVGPVYENIPLTSRAVRLWNAEQPLPATAVSPPSGGRMTQSRRHWGAQGHLRPPHEISREAQRQ